MNNVTSVGGMVMATVAKWRFTPRSASLSTIALLTSHHLVLHEVETQ